MSILARIELELATFARAHGADYAAFATFTNDRGTLSYRAEMHRGGSVHEGTAPTLAEALANAANARMFGVDQWETAPVRVQTGGA